MSRAWANDAVSSTWLRADKGRKNRNENQDEKRARKPAKRHASLETIIYIK